MKIRIKFAKVGPMKFVGYLDTLRFFQKAIRRAEIDIAYSTGYSPHQIMSFAAPLGVGVESEGEYFDMEVHSFTTSEDMRNRLNSVMPEFFSIASVRLLPDTIKNAMASVVAAKYVVNLRKGYEAPFSWEDSIEEFMEQESIMVWKKSKKSEREIDVKPLIYQMNICQKGVELVVNASSGANIKPKLVMQALYEHNGATLGEYDIEVTRIEMYGLNQEEVKMHKEQVTNGLRDEYEYELDTLLALEDFGNDF
ncbi:MAG: TIGR03936 family radical SAM-associated protein [Eubacteriales bacterium]